MMIYFQDADPSWSDRCGTQVANWCEQTGWIKNKILPAYVLLPLNQGHQGPRMPISSCGNGKRTKMLKLTQNEERSMRIVEWCLERKWGHTAGRCALKPFRNRCGQNCSTTSKLGSTCDFHRPWHNWSHEFSHGVGVINPDGIIINPLKKHTWELSTVVVF